MFEIVLKFEKSPPHSQVQKHTCCEYDHTSKESVVVFCLKSQYTEYEPIDSKQNIHKSQTSNEEHRALTGFVISLHET